MTEKRFTYFKSKIGFGKQGIDDNLKGYTFDFTMDNVLDCMNDLADENEQLKKRNTNQYNQLTELWEIIEEENWEKLIAMKKQLKEDEERLQKEWRSYE